MRESRLSDDCSVAFLLMARGRCVSLVFKLGNDVNITRDGDKESGVF